LHCWRGVRQPSAELLDLHALPYIGGLQLKALNTLHLSDLHGLLLQKGRRDGKKGGLHARTVGHVHRALHRMLKRAVRWKLIAVNPTTDMELPSIPKTVMATITRQPAAALLVACTSSSAACR
jgi:site-specific recombinase XerC